jgi:hypothetical protein
MWRRVAAAEEENEEAAATEVVQRVREEQAKEMAAGWQWL